MVVLMEDKDEVLSAVAALKLQVFKGTMNKCPACEKTGYFGSVASYECESGHWYLLCGWCGTITRQKKRGDT